MVTPSDRLNKPLFANGFIIAFASIFSLITVSFIFVAFLNRQSFKPAQTANYKLMEHGQILIRRLSARFDFLLPSYYGVNRCLSQPGTVYHKPAQYGRSYQYSRFGLSPLLQKVGKTNDVIQCHRYDIFHI